MTEFRRLAVAAAMTVPLSVLTAGVSSAGIADGPDEFGVTETSGTYAGIGGAGTYESFSGSADDGDWWWSEESATTAGPLGAAVVHSGEAGSDDEDEAWSDDDRAGRPAVAHGKRHVAVNESVSPPLRRHVHSLPAHTYSRPSHDTGDVGYVETTKTADLAGASSSHVASHAGHDYAVYHSSDLSAGPEGAVSEGVKAVAVPEFAGYDKWYTAAGATGAVAHEVSSVADATDDDWDATDNDWDATDDGWHSHHTHYRH
ncbi:hypothetical protein AB0M83_33195 [Amycolatopsis sp. NPDC051106]|uniref:hypothetical protein n=1 Tax=unclassified Amycolatopsis TaxID=2618356 RepID=UPI0034276806